MPRRPRARSALAAAAALLAAAAPAAAQLSGSNLLLGQAGNLPPAVADRGLPNRQSFYDQLNVQYQFERGLVGARFETDRNSEEELVYEGITQRYLEWSDRGLRLRIGNFYTLLGRGLVLRSFELPGVVLEKSGRRTRLAPSRDVDGVLAELERGPLSLRALGGSPTEGITSLAEVREFGEQRHRGHVAGGQASLAVWRQARIGAAYLRTGFGRPGGPAQQQELASGFVDLDPLRLLGVAGPALPLYVEYAQRDRSFADGWRLDTRDRVPHALYAGANLIWGAFDLSAEWKDYSRFRLGVNDPPTLVREHAQTLLNRSTHVTDAQDEEGWQIEAAVRPIDTAHLLVNLSRTDGARGDRFEERYLEVHAMPDGAAWEATLWYDQGADSSIAILNRDAYGALATVRFGERAAVALDVARQTAERKSFIEETGSIGPRGFENVYLALTGSLARLGSLGMVWERTTDRLDPSWEAGRTKPLHLLGWTVSAWHGGHEATLFVGQRRGGLACTAGTCYEVPPFEGAELRVTSRF